MATVNETMTALATEIRELSGTTGKKGLDAMISDVNDANAEISDQMGLIAQINAALEGKASGGGGSGGVETCILTLRAWSPLPVRKKFII